MEQIEVIFNKTILYCENTCDPDGCNLSSTKNSEMDQQKAMEAVVEVG
ncbi:MAG: hypothetical protein ABFD79_02920 [Phycisphaerales bacterium]